MAETRNDVVNLAGLQIWTSLDVPEDLEALVADRLKRYQSEAESLMKRPCSVVVTDEVITDRSGSLLVTSRRPVISVQALNPVEDFVITTSGVIRLTGTGVTTYPALTGPTTFHTVSYTSALRPEDIEAVRGCVYERMVRSLTREIDETQGVKSSGEEGLSFNLQDSEWLEGERTALTNLRRRVSA